MNRLTNREMQSLFKATTSLYTNQQTETLAPRIFAAVREVASAEIYGLNTFHPQGFWLEQTWQEPVSTATPKELEGFYQYAHTHPLYDAFVKTGLPEPRKTSDFVSMNEFQRFAVYNEFYRKFGVDQQMVCGLSISPELTLMLSLNRRRKDFTESHRRQIAALRPHLIDAAQNAEAISRLRSQSTQMEVALDESDCGAILIDAAARVRLVTTRARVWLAKYFPAPHGSATQLPEELMNWLGLQLADCANGLALNPGRSLRVLRAGDCLRIRFLKDFGEGHTVLLMSEEVETSARELEARGLTPREAEVVYWVVKGKTNAAIAILCDISERTVHKHLEDVYQKLGVETRTAAAQKVLTAGKNGSGWE